MTRLEPAQVIDFASVARARKVRFIVQALREYCLKHEPGGASAMHRVAKSLTIEGRLLVETRAAELAGTKKPRPASETTWAQVLDELAEEGLEEEAGE